MGAVQASATPSQSQRYYGAVERSARENETFLHLVQHGMTKRDLKRCIESRPSLWGKYEHWLVKLPD